MIMISRDPTRPERSDGHNTDHSLNSEERYGLRLCREYVPIQRFNAWVSERSEYTRMHAFVNCDALNLTANRGSVENTPQDLLEDVEATVRRVFADRVEGHPDYDKFQDEPGRLRKTEPQVAASSPIKRRNVMGTASVAT